MIHTGHWQGARITKSNSVPFAQELTMKSSIGIVRLAGTVSALVCLFACLAHSAWAGAIGVYPAMAPLAQYEAASQDEEVALAKSAAPADVAAHAEVMAFGPKGYETVVKGTNGFVCLVQRAWAQDFDAAEFWNPKLRGPLCLNPAAVRSILPDYLKRTQWVLVGVSKDEMLARTKAEVATKEITAPEPGAMSYMLAKGGYLGDAAGGHWHPHVMFFEPPTDPKLWGADVTGGEVYSFTSDVEPVTIFFVLAPKWSDGTPAEDHH
jgi:hypothetical protein